MTTTARAAGKGPGQLIDRDMDDSLIEQEAQQGYREEPQNLAGALDPALEGPKGITQIGKGNGAGIG